MDTSDFQVIQDMITRSEERIEKRIDAIEKEMSDANKLVADHKDATTRYVVTAVVSFLSGGGLIIIAEVVKYLVGGK